MHTITEALDAYRQDTTDLILKCRSWTPTALIPLNFRVYFIHCFHMTEPLEQAVFHFNIGTFAGSFAFTTRFILHFCQTIIKMQRDNTVQSMLIFKKAYQRDLLW